MAAQSSVPARRTTSPQWDSRNSGFIPPTKLAELRANTPQHTFNSSSPQQPTNQLQFPSSDSPSARSPDTASMSPSDRPSLRSPLANGSQAGHNRTSSFFSFRKQNGDSAPQRSPSMLSKAQPNGSVMRSDTSSQGQRGPSQQQQQPPPPTSSQGPPPLQGQPSSDQLARVTSAASQPQQLHPEIRSVVQLNGAHAHKIYFSGPLVRRIERQPDGQRPSKDDGWTEVWAQLGGTTLSIWDMKQVQEASQQGKEVPPAYVNMTDAFVQVLGSVTVPATPETPAKRYANVLTLNTAGSNLLLFSCPTTAALISWAAALRLSAWEKSRLEEIYTAHLLRITLSGRDVPTTLVQGRMEGWVRIRVAGQTDWKKLWMVVSNGGDGAADPGSAGKKKRMSNLFSRDHQAPPQNTPTKPMLSMYISPKPKDRKKALLTMTDVSQAFAVYPERPELISRSTLVKVEGLLGDEDTAAGMRGREGWLLVMPELEGGLGQAAEMLKWVVALHDAFTLYGRPQAWTWDPRDPISLMFAYPVGPHKDLLFLERELSESLDPRDDRTSSIRSRLLNILQERMRGTDGAAPAASETVSSPPPVGMANVQQEQHPEQPVASGSGSGYQLPPLSFNDSRGQSQDRPLLTPITETSSVYTHRQSMSMSGDTQSMLQPKQSLRAGSSSHAPETVPEEAPHAPAPQTVHMIGNTLTQSPTSSVGPSSPPLPEKDSLSLSNSRRSHESSMRSQPRGGTSISAGRASLESHLPSPNPANVQLPLSPLTSPSSERAPSAFANFGRSNSPQSSILTSPHSIAGEESVANHSILTSPYSPVDAPRHSMQQAFGSTSPPRLTAKSPARGTDALSADDSNFSNEAGALYYMQFDQEANNSHSNNAPQRRIPTTIPERSSDAEDDETSNESSDNKSPRPTSTDRYSATSSPPTSTKSPPIRQSTPMAFERLPQPEIVNALPIATPEPLTPNTRTILGRKPSGARAQAKPAYVSDRRLSSQHLAEEDSHSEDSMHSDSNLKGRLEDVSSAPPPRMSSERLKPADDSDNLDALAALSYLAADENQPTSPRTVEPLRPRTADRGAASPSPTPATTADTGATYKSSFAPSKQAAERKAKVQAQQAAQHAAAHRPGRANGKKKLRAVDNGAWNESSDEEEEEEEEEEEDDDVDSDDERPATNKAPSSGIASSNVSVRPPQNQGPAHGEYGQDPQPTYSHLRPPRNLPQIPGGRPTLDGDDYPPPARRQVSDYQSEAGRRTLYDDGTQIRSQADFPQPGAARQSVWSQVLDPGRTPGTPPEPSNGRDTFVQLEPQSQTMTKAFTPQGLLSAGLQDKQDRSAKRQEALARESGASLINVPNKPPPPQTGLLGAITAHERDRKREGGVGAALTEREREKRLAEDRQRRFDDHQRQQLDQMQQGGSMYGSPQFNGFNPMMNPMMMGMNPMMGMSPMMTGAGMNPMMTGQGMSPMMTGQGMSPMMTGQGMNPMMTGFPGMMPGYNPQHMFAAQQAAQAYQQAMMAFSVAGSQAGGEGGGGTPQANSPMNMGTFDPRMSMMGMPMMGGPMGGQSQMGSPMGQMGSPMGSPMGMGPQMTGLSGFDPRFPPANSPPLMNDPNLLPPGGLGSQGPGQYRSNNSSPNPNRRGSPLARPVDHADPGRPSSRPTSPKL